MKNFITSALFLMEKYVHLFIHWIQSLPKSIQQSDTENWFNKKLVIQMVFIMAEMV